MTESRPSFPDAILSGGTGRSGTTIIGKLLARHSQIGLSRPSEIKMLTSGNGLLDLYLGRRVGRYRRLLVTDRLHLERFRYRLFHDWWEREAKLGGIVGIVQGMEPKELEELYRLMKIDWREGPQIASVLFLRRFIDSQKRVSGKPKWIDTTPVNLFRAGELAEMLPEARFIHMIRDGRDVISSVIREPWGPKDYFDGLEWYRNRMIRILTNTNGIKFRAITISLEELVITKRQESLEALLNFLGIKNESKLQDYFDQEITSERIRRERWREEVENLSNFNHRYFEIVSELKSIDPKVPLLSL